ncbi:decapping 5 [Babesia ovata]|uniref:Decapping 5 n=1 Tax=Babesia ovata TaxID=189622 RepID=A0A2H6K7R2_9APIC|nr:decapping 5 [Babesia ovata]GBE59042.1 decapping 5 [Babesia ovata]
MAIEAFIGSRISITTNSELRYEGLLFDLNSDDAMIVLQNVQCMGTENRTTNGGVPPSKRIHDYMVFKGEDIKDLGVCEVKKDNSPEYSVFNEPATQGAPFNNQFGQPGGPGPAPMYGPRDGPNGQGFGGMPPPQMMGSPMMPPMGSPMYMPPARGMYMGPPSMPGPMMVPPMGRPMGPPPMHDGPLGAHDARQPPPSPYWQEPGSLFGGGMPTGMPHRDEMHPGGADKRMPGPMFMDSSTPPRYEGDSDRFDLRAFDFGPDPFAEGDALGGGEPNSSAPEDESGLAGQRHVEKREGFPKSVQHKVMAPTQHERKPLTPVNEFNIIKAEKLLASLGGADVKGDAGPSQTKPSTVVPDVKQAKPEKAEVVAAKEEQELRTYYDKKSSFFDNLSSDVHSDKKMLRKERQKQHEINVDTFGADSVRRSHNNRGRGRGDRRGGGERGRRGSWNPERGERRGSHKAEPVETAEKAPEKDKDKEQKAEVPAASADK